MRSLTRSFLDSLSFSARQLETLTTIGAYQGKQALFDERLPDTLKAAGEAGLRLGVVTTPTAWNQHQIEDMVALCDGLGYRSPFRGRSGRGTTGTPRRW